MSGHRGWRTVCALHEQIEARKGQRVHLATDPTCTGYILGGGIGENDEPYWTMSWDATGPDHDDLYRYRRYRGHELIALPMAPTRTPPPRGEQLSLFGGAP